MASDADTLADLLRRIESADAALFEALHERARAVKAVAALKQAHPETYVPLPRDVDVVERARQSGDDFPVPSLEAVVREVVMGTEGLVAPVTVAYPGPDGGFAHAAARKHFGASAALTSRESVDAAVDDLQRGRVRFAVLPFETTSDGAVTATLHALIEADVRIVAELTCPATYRVMSRTGSPGDVDKVIGVGAAIAACEKQLRRLYPRATVIDAPTGAGAADLVREDHGAALVAPEIFADEFGLRIVHERVEDVPGIDIRFAVAGTDHPARTGLDRTVLAVAVTDEPGALYRSLRAFADRGINLTRVEARPGRRMPWRYIFFLELDGHITDRVVLTAVEELRSTSPFVKVLGSYARPS